MPFENTIPVGLPGVPEQAGPQQGQAQSLEQILKLLGLGGPGGGIPQTPPLINQPQIPVQTPQPIRRAQATPVPTGPFASPGQGKRAAFSSLIGTVSNIAETAQKNHEDKKIRDLSYDIERVLIAAQNPQDPHNQQVLNDIMNDPKKRKAIAEAMNIKFGQPEDERSPEAKAALEMAQQKIKQQEAAQPPMQGNAPAPQAAPVATPVQQQQPQAQPQQGGLNSYASQFMRQMPQAQVTNPAYAAQQAALKTAAPIIKTQMEIESKNRNTDVTAQARVLDAQTKAANEQLKIYWDTRTKIYAADKRLDGSLAHAKAASKLADAIAATNDYAKRVTMVKEASTEINNAVKVKTENLTELNKELKAAVENDDKPKVKELMQQIMEQKKDLQSYQMFQRQVVSKLGAAVQQGVSGVGGNGTTTNSPAGTKPGFQPIGGPDISGGPKTPEDLINNFKLDSSFGSALAGAIGSEPEEDEE